MNDGPLASIEEAGKVARSIDRSGIESIRIVIREGTYYLDRPLHLGVADSGSRECDVVYEAFPGEFPIVSAGVRIEGWSETTHNGRRAWIAPAPGFKFHSIWVNDQRRYRPRYPREGRFRTVGALPGPFYEGTSEFHVRPEDTPHFVRQDDVEMVYFAVWTESRLPIESIDRDSGVIHTKLRSAMNACDVKESSHYYFDNVFEELTEPGQWYLDETEELFYSNEKI